MLVASYMDFVQRGRELLAKNFGFSQKDNSQGVLGFGIGLQWDNGDFSDQVGLVLLVKKGKEGFPYRAVEVQIGGEVQNVPCCAFVLDGIDYHPVPARPVVGAPPLQLGTPLAVTPGYAEGTWACFLGQPAKVAVTAAHLFGIMPEGQPVYCGTRRVGSLLKRHKGDVALVGLDEESARKVSSHLPNGQSVGGATRLSLNSLGRRGLVYRPTRQDLAAPRILAAEMTLHLLLASGEVLTQNDAIMTEGCTHSGDSGTGLLMEAGYAVGVLSHSRKEFSFFESIHDIHLS